MLFLATRKQINRIWQPKELRMLLRDGFLAGRKVLKSSTAHNPFWITFE